MARMKTDATPTATPMSILVRWESWVTVDCVPSGERAVLEEGVVEEVEIMTTVLAGVRRCRSLDAHSIESGHCIASTGLCASVVVPTISFVDPSCSAVVLTSSDVHHS